jgi:hypothetical protein
MASDRLLGRFNNFIERNLTSGGSHESPIETISYKFLEGTNPPGRHTKSAACLAIMAKPSNLF